MLKNEFDSPIPIVIAFTENYFVSASVLLTSLLQNSSHTKTFHIICLISDDLPKRMEESFNQINSDRLTFEFLNLKNKIPDIYIDPKFTVAASYRLLLPELLLDYNKVLYVDCDIIIRMDMAEFFLNTDLEGYYLAAVYESVLDHQIDYIKKLGCSAEKYFNSGVLLFNLSELRRDNMTSKFIESSKCNKLKFPDQDVLNIHCQNRTLGVDPVYNSIRTFYVPQYKKIFLNTYNIEQWKIVQNSGNVHYTGRKPWNSYTLNFGLWWKYYYFLPNAIRKEGQINKSCYYFSLFYNKYYGEALLKLIKSFYRKLR